MAAFRSSHYISLFTVDHFCGKSVTMMPFIFHKTENIT